MIGIVIVIGIWIGNRFGIRFVIVIVIGIVVNCSSNFHHNLLQDKNENILNKILFDYELSKIHEIKVVKRKFIIS